MKLCVVVPCFCETPLARECIGSLVNQISNNDSVYWIDDAGYGTAEMVKRYLLGVSHAESIVHTTPHRRGAICNIFHAAKYFVRDDTTVTVQLDGDDYLLPGALARVREIFSNPDIWVMHANYKRSDGGPPWATGRYQSADFRNSPCQVAGLRAWRSPLLRKVHEEDFKIGGFWQTSGWDNALMLPMLELAGLSRVHYEEQPLSVYRIHEDNDRKDPTFQEFSSWYSRCRPKYSRLETLEDTPTRTPHVLKTAFIGIPGKGPSILPCEVDGERVKLG